MKKTSILFLAFILTTVSVIAQTVYVTRTGSKYHSEGCRYLSRSQIAISLSDALSQGYDACSVCDPPTSVVRRHVKHHTKHHVSRKNTVQCSAFTKSGKRCRRMTTNANGRCWQH